MNDIKQLVIRYSMIIMVVTFAIIVSCAFLYKSDNSEESMLKENTVSNTVYEERKSASYYESDMSENKYANEESEDEKSDSKLNDEGDKSTQKRFYKDYSVVDDIPEIEKPLNEIGADKVPNQDSVSQNPEEKAFDKADELRHQNKYESAVYEYEKIALNTSDNITKARCYEEIANTYSSIRRYLSAIPFAQTSFDLNASERVKKLLIDLYIKTGNFEKADKLMAVKIEEPEKTAELKTSEGEDKNVGGIQNLEPIE